MKYGIKRTRWISLAMVFLLLAAGGLWRIFDRLEGTAPVVTIDPPFAAIGKQRDFFVQAEDTGSGLRSLSVSLVQETKTIVLLGLRFDGAKSRAPARIPLRMVPAEHGLADGPARLVVEAYDRSWRRWWNGNLTRIDRTVLIDSLAPTIEVVSKAHNFNQGGSGLVIYRVSEPCATTGVTIGQTFFPARSGLFENSLLMAAFVALGHDQGKGTPIALMAEDEAGNQTLAGLRHLIRTKQWRQDVLEISDSFLTGKLPEISALVPEAAHQTPLAQYLRVNNEVRQANYKKIVELTGSSGGQLHWHDAFIPLPRAANRANFADKRVYRHHGKDIDHQVHMGIDLASLANSPVPAGNRGRVVFAETLGIYGHTVILDHGFNLFSMYSHLSQIDVRPGQMIDRGAILGRTGTTGLAGGDHLHYGMMIGSTFVNPIEWWDEQWIRHNVTDKIAAAGGKEKEVTKVTSD